MIENTTANSENDRIASGPHEDLATLDPTEVR
jgi:hypothetical protein